VDEEAIALAEEPFDEELARRARGREEGGEVGGAEGVRPRGRGEGGEVGLGGGGDLGEQLPGGGGAAEAIGGVDELAAEDRSLTISA
jgi:hypothetical protein